MTENPKLTAEPMTITLTPSHQWIMLEALVFLTSPDGLAHIEKRYPNMNWSILGKEIDELISQFPSADAPAPKAPKKK